MTIAEHARQVETALDQLTRAGWDAGSEPVAEGIYPTIRDLAASARVLTEVTDHLSNGLAARAELGRLRLDEHGQARYQTPDAAIAAARIALADATQAARALATALNEAQQIASTIADTGNLPPDRGPCLCGHHQDVHDGDQADGECTILTRPAPGADLEDCGCPAYRPAADVTLEREGDG
ncbi:MAG TPA: hypothetical protein VF228_17345 [Iamia sp.]